MWDTHTSCMGSPFPMVHAKWSLVFLSSATFSQRLETALSLVYNNNTRSGLVFRSKAALMSEALLPIVQLCLITNKKHLSRAKHYI